PGVAAAQRGVRDVSAAALLRRLRRGPINLPARGRGRRRGDCFTRDDDDFRRREFYFGFSECALAFPRPDCRSSGWTADGSVFTDAALSLALRNERDAGCDTRDRYDLSWLAHANERARIRIAVSLAWRLRGTGNVGQGHEPVAHSAALRRFDDQIFTRTSFDLWLAPCVRSNNRGDSRYLR